jgi:hypothetical protein
MRAVTATPSRQSTTRRVKGQLSIACSESMPNQHKRKQGEKRDSSCEGGHSLAFLPQSATITRATLHVSTKSRCALI